jgi:hypothetical protein
MEKNRMSVPDSVIFSATEIVKAAVAGDGGGSLALNYPEKAAALMDVVVDKIMALKGLER